MTFKEMAENGYFADTCKPKALHSFFILAHELGEEPTLEQFEKATGLKKSSYYRVRKQYREIKENPLF